MDRVAVRHAGLSASGALMKKTFWPSLAMTLFCGVGHALAADGANTSVPSFAPDGLTGWIPVTYGDLFDPPASGPGPVVDDPAHPFVSNREFGSSGRQPTF